ncbi:MAG TPA: malate dehydrogenase [Anaerohalosphaeraceae bacterium]|nr:malate dehydrogenase [Anaerohalosphaeraceae bacterium]
MRAKITIVGAGNVGATAAFIAASRNVGDIVLVDIVPGLAEGKALDMAQSAGVYSFAGRIRGTTDWDAAAGSDIVIITSGLPRKPGMSRDDLLFKNAEIVRSVTQQIVRTSPNAFIIVVCNPLDAMVYAAAAVSRFEHRRVMGMAGVLDSARFAAFIAEQLNVSVSQVSGILLGGHGDDMVPLPRYTTVGGVPLTQLMDASTIQKLVERTRNGGIEIVNLLGTSAYYAPAAGAVRMAEAILRDEKALLCCCAYCEKEYGVGGAFVGVPAVLGAGGVEKVMEFDLTEEEQKAFDASVGRVKALVEKLKSVL